MINQNTIQRLLYFVQNLEQKLSSVIIIHDKLQQLMTTVSTTHQTILEELSNVKAIINQITIEQEEKQVITKDEKTCERDNHEDKDSETKTLNENVLRKVSPSINENNDLISNSVSSTSKTHRNLKKPDQSARIRLSKSVSFSVDQNILNQRLSKETKSVTPDEITLPILSSSSDLSKGNPSEITPTIGKILTNIRIHEIEPKTGDYLRLLNISNSDDYDLSGHFLQQNINVSTPLCRFRFPSNTIIRAGQTVTVWCGNSKDITPEPPRVFLWKEQRKWETGPECLTILTKPNGQSIAWFKNSRCVNPDQSSSDILLLHSKSNMGLSDTLNSSSSSLRSSLRLSARQNLLSAFHSFGNNKFPFAHSANSPIHPNHNGTTVNTSNDLRSQLNQRVGLSQIFQRSGSSPFRSYMDGKQYLSSFNLSRTEQKQTTVKT